MVFLSEEELLRITQTKTLCCLGLNVVWCVKKIKYTEEVPPKDQRREAYPPPHGKRLVPTRGAAHATVAVWSAHTGNFGWCSHFPTIFGRFNEQTDLFFFFFWLTTTTENFANKEEKRHMLHSSALSTFFHHQHQAVQEYYPQYSKKQIFFIVGK